MCLRGSVHTSVNTARKSACATPESRREASARVLKNRAAQSHLSILTRIIKGNSQLKATSTKRALRPGCDWQSSRSVAKADPGIWPGPLSYHPGFRRECSHECEHGTQECVRYA